MPPDFIPRIDRDKGPIHQSVFSGQRAKHARARHTSASHSGTDLKLRRTK
jgi:hypothetical protein